MSGNRGADAILAAHGRLCSAFAGRAGQSLQDMVCADWFQLRGPEPGDAATSAAGLAALVAALRSRPYHLGFAWTEREVTRAPDTAWVVARGTLILTGRHLVERRRYTLAGALEKQVGRWRWRIVDLFEDLDGRAGFPPPPDPA